MAKTALQHVAVCDIDGTLMTEDMKVNGGTKSQLAAAQFVRDYFDQNGTFTVSTAQTAEMIMSEDAYNASVRRGFRRRRPNLGGVPGKRLYVPPQSIACRKAFTDPALIMSMGTGNFKREDGAYIEDLRLRKKFGSDWRPAAKLMLESLSEHGPKNLLRFLAPIELEDNYKSGKTDVWPHDFRIQCDFVDEDMTHKELEGLKNDTKRRILSFLELMEKYLQFEKLSDNERSEILVEFGAILGNLVVSDESRPDEKLQLYLTPPDATKEKMANEGLAQLSEGETIEHLYVFGDMPPDLPSGAFAGSKLAKRATFGLAGGSPLTPYFWRGGNLFGKTYAGEDIGWMRNNLEPTEREGFEIFHAEDQPPRLFFFGDIAYPGRVGPETYEAFLKDPDKPVLP